MLNPKPTCGMPPPTSTPNTGVPGVLGAVLGPGRGVVGVGVGVGVVAPPLKHPNAVTLPGWQATLKPLQVPAGLQGPAAGLQMVPAGFKAPVGQVPSSPVH